MTRDTARGPIRGPTATSISLSLNGATLSNILLTNNFFFHCTYVGSVVNGELHGQGTYYWTSGEKHKGTFVNDECTGPGIRSFPDGDVYDGSHLAYLKHGEGTYTFSDGTKYIGSYVDDKCHGQGINIFASGETYEGSFSHGKWNGQGINTLADGQRYSHFLENLFLFLSTLKSFCILDSKGFLSTT